MNCAGSCGLLKSVAAIGGLVVVGLGGYNLISTGCVLGRCSAESNITASLTPVAGTEKSGGCCELTADCETAAACEGTAASCEGTEKPCEEAKESTEAKTAEEPMPTAPETVAGRGG